MLTTHDETLKLLRKHRLVAILRGIDAPDAVKVAEALYRGGIRALEFTFDHSKTDCVEANCRCIRAVREQLLQKYPERKFIIVDTLSISAPQAILVLKAYELAAQGKTIEEVADWLEQNKTRAQAFFTVDDLKYLQRGGRISAAAAAMGGLLDLKPVILESKEGTLVSFAKVRGRKKAINFLVEQVLENIGDPKEAVGIVLHADVPEEAEALKSALSAHLPEMEIRIDPVGPVIGAHCGPGTLAFCFLGKERPQ